MRKRKKFKFNVTTLRFETIESIAKLLDNDYNGTYFIFHEGTCPPDVRNKHHWAISIGEQEGEPCISIYGKDLDQTGFPPELPLKTLIAITKIIESEIEYQKEGKNEE